MEKQTNFKRDWGLYNTSQTEEKSLALRIIHDVVEILEIEEKGNVNGRPRIGMKNMLKCVLIKVYNNFSTRRTIHDLRIAKGLNYIDYVPHFNSISNYLRNQEITEYLEKVYKILAIPFKHVDQKFALDATGFGGYCTRWLSSREEKKTWKSFNKLHVVAGVSSNIIAEAKVTKATKHEVLLLPEMIRNTTKIFDVKEVYGDRGYLAIYNINAIRSIGAVPYIDIKKNTKLFSKKKWVTGEFWDVMVSLARNYPEKFYKHYYLRNNVEAVFSSMKRKQISYVRSKDPISQKNEILAKVCCHNVCVLINGIFCLGIRTGFKNIEL
jgi:transposase